MVITDKNTLRLRFLGARKTIPQAQAEEASRRLAGHLLQAIPADGKLIAAYSAIHNEINLADAMEKLHARGHSLCLPVVVAAGSPLLFRRYKPGDGLEKDAYGIDVPLAASPEVVPDIVLVPLAAFDSHGHRLGYGAGYYDRSIPLLRQRKKDIQMIGVAYNQQEVERIPVDEHDQKLDAVVTDLGWRTFA